MRISETVGKMIKVMLLATLVIIIVGAAYYRSLAAIPFGLGVLTTASLNIIKTILLERTVERAANMQNATNAILFVHGQNFMRLALTGVILVLAATLLTELYFFWGAVAGIFTYHPAKYSLGAISAKAIQAEDDSNKINDNLKQEG